MKPEYYNWESAIISDEKLLVERLTDGYIKRMDYETINQAIEQNQYFAEGNPEKPNRLGFWLKAKEVYNGLVSIDK